MSMIRPLGAKKSAIAIIVLLALICFFALLFYMFYRAY